MKILDYNQTEGFSGHEQIVFLEEEEGSGLTGFIAIHSTVRGPVLGGTRLLRYPNSESALIDALKLSSAMSYKCAIAGLPFGGGKGVIIAPPEPFDRKTLLASYAKQVNKLAGKFYTGEDVGISEADVQHMLQSSPYFIGKTHQAGDPSPYAALSVFELLSVALKEVFDDNEIADRSFAVKGVGKTGTSLVERLVSAGARVFVADINPKQIAALQARFPQVEPVPAEKILSLPVDVYCPCALGNDITLENYSQLRAKLVIGTANNQLANPQVAELLWQKGIWHIPDYIANAGGLINVADELLPGGYSLERVLGSIKKLDEILERILKQAKLQNIFPDELADASAREQLGLDRA